MEHAAARQRAARPYVAQGRGAAATQVLEGVSIGSRVDEEDSHEDRRREIMAAAKEKGVEIRPQRRLRAPKFGEETLCEASMTGIKESCRPAVLEHSAAGTLLLAAALTGAH